MPKTWKGRLILLGVLLFLAWGFYEKNFGPPLEQINCGGVKTDKYFCNFMRSSREEQEEILDDYARDRRDGSYRR